MKSSSQTSEICDQGTFFTVINMSKLSHICQKPCLVVNLNNGKTCFDQAINCFERHVFNTSARLIHPSGLSGLSLIIDEKSCIAASAFSLYWNENTKLLLNCLWKEQCLLKGHVAPHPASAWSDWGNEHYPPTPGQQYCNSNKGLLSTTSPTAQHCHSVTVNWGWIYSIPEVTKHMQHRSKLTVTNHNKYLNMLMTNMMTIAENWGESITACKNFQAYMYKIK